MINLLDYVKSHPLGRAITIAALCVSTTWVALNEILVKPRDFEIQVQTKNISNLNEELRELKATIRSVNIDSAIAIDFGKCKLQIDELNTQLAQKEIQMGQLNSHIDNLKAANLDLTLQRDKLNADAVFFSGNKKDLGSDDQRIDQVLVIIATSNIDNAVGKNITVSLIVDKMILAVSGVGKDYFEGGRRYSFTYKLPGNVVMTLGDLRRSVMVLSHNCKDNDWRTNEIILKVRFATGRTDFLRYKRWHGEDVTWLGTRETDGIYPAAILLQPNRPFSTFTQILPSLVEICRE